MEREYKYSWSETQDRMIKAESEVKKLSEKVKKLKEEIKNKNELLKPSKPFPSFFKQKELTKTGGDNNQEEV